MSAKSPEKRAAQFAPESVTDGEIGIWPAGKGLSPPNGDCSKWYPLIGANDYSGGSRILKGADFSAG